MNRKIWQLSLAQALMLSVNSLIVTTAAIVGYQLADHKSMATLPTALQMTSVMLASYPASMMMYRYGRRAGFLIASVIGLLGASACIAGIYLESFWLFCFGTIGTGIYTGFGNFFRFAAIEVTSAERKNTAISFVLAGGVLAAVVGPNLASLGRDLLAVTFVGSYLFVFMLYTMNGFNFLLLKLPPMQKKTASSTQRPLAEIIRQPVFIVASISAATGYGLMVLLMTATPLAMTEVHHPFADIAFVIQWHVLGMFVPSFFTGHLINRFGAVSIIISGIALISLCVVINLMGDTLWLFWSALLLLGVGWNFLFTGGTSLLTESYYPEEAAKVQGVNDFIVFSTSAVFALSAGILHHQLGWIVINYAVTPLLFLCLLMQVGWLLSRRRQTAVS